MTSSKDEPTVVRHALASHAILGTQHEANVTGKLLGWAAMGCFFFSVVALLPLFWPLP